MSFERRDFLKFLALGCISPSLTTLASCTHRRFYNPDQDIILGGGRFKQNDKIRHVLAAINMQQKENNLVDLNFLAHGVIIDPKDKKRIIALENNGPGAAEIDLNTHTLSTTIKTNKDKLFSGHGAFSKSGDTLFCTETFISNHKGIIAVRDASSLEIIEEISTYGENPHECKLIDDGATLVITNTGSESAANSQPSVTYIDIQSQKLIERVILTNEQLNTGHIDIAEDGSLVVASAPRKGQEEFHTGGVSIRSGKQPMISMTEPKVVINKMTGEALSVIVDNKRNIAAVTHPDANMVTFWSVDKRKLLKAMSVPKPRGITLSLDGKSFILSYDVNTSVVFISTKDLNARSDSIMQPTYTSGSHIYNWSKILTEIMPTDVYT